MKLRYIIPPIGIGMIYLLYKSFSYSSKDFDFGEPFEENSLEKRIDDIDWGLMTGWELEEKKEAWKKPIVKIVGRPRKEEWKINTKSRRGTQRRINDKNRNEESS